MRRRVVLGTVAGVAVALAGVSAGLVVSPISAAAPAARSSCNLTSNNCVGYRWGGLTRQPGVPLTTVNVSAGAIAFSTDLSKRWMGQLEVDVVGEHCTAYPAGPIPIAAADGRHEYRVV